jgi:molecular chaperone GrpE
LPAAGAWIRKEKGQFNEVTMSHSNVDEAVTTEAVDVATLVAENASLRDRLLRALADADNTRRRAERAAEEARKYAIADFARELLAVADNFQRTIAAASRHSPETVEDQALIEGVRATERLLEHTFSSFGIQKIDALGKPFDPTLHEAVMEVDDPSQPPGTVVRVVEDGYTIHDRLLRPARVLVAKRSPNAASFSQMDGAAAEFDSR